MEKRRIIINEDDPQTGDFGFTVYDDAHPKTGKEGVIERYKKSLTGLRGHEVTVTVRGVRVDPESARETRWSAKRSLVLNSYSDLFGANGVLISALKSQMKRDSDSELDVTSITIDEFTGENDE